MSTTTLQPGAPAALFAARLLRRIARMPDSWREAARRRRDAAIIADLPDHILRDVGITRDVAATLSRLTLAGGRR